MRKVRYKVCNSYLLIEFYFKNGKIILLSILPQYQSSLFSSYFLHFFMPIQKRYYLNKYK